MAYYAREIGVKVKYEPIDSRSDCMHNIDQILEFNPEISLHTDIGHFNLWGRIPVEYLQDTRTEYYIFICMLATDFMTYICQWEKETLTGII